MELVIVDTAQIQPYIFRSNRLRENLGASYLVAQATLAWGLEAVRDSVQCSNILLTNSLDPSLRIEDPALGLEAEVLYSGGGNLVVLFQSEHAARAFTRRLSTKVLTDAPNLQLVITSVPFTWEQSLQAALNELQAELAAEKRARTLSNPLLGLGVTVGCSSTGLPATEVVRPIADDPDSAYPAAPEIVAKLVVVEEANAELRNRFRSVINKGYDFATELTHIALNPQERNYLALVHADGNGTGRRMQEWGVHYASPAQNRAFIDSLRALSLALTTATNKAVEHVVAEFMTLIEEDLTKPEQERRFRLRQEAGKTLLPFRPIVLSGDDVTFLCPGELGVTLAVELLKEYEQQTSALPDGGGNATMCAGVTIAKTHFPFARAYTLAEELCTSAKDYRRELKSSGSYLDWYFASSGFDSSLAALRAKDYKVRAGCLTLRPVALDSSPTDCRSWEVVRKGIDLFQRETWSGRRNKLKALREALRAGPEATQAFLLKYNASLDPVCPSQANWASRAWQGGLCGYYDALELADWYIPVKEG